MKVLIKRPLFLGGASYAPDKAGVEIPDKIGDQKVVLFSQEAKDANAKKMEGMYESPLGMRLGQLKAESGDDEKKEPAKPRKPGEKPEPLDIVLPRDCVEYSDEAAKDFLYEGQPLLRGTTAPQHTLSDLIPPLSKAEAGAKDAPKPADPTDALAVRAENAAKIQKALGGEEPAPAPSKAAEQPPTGAGSAPAGKAGKDK